MFLSGLFRVLLPRPLYEAIGIYRGRTFVNDGLISSHISDFTNDRKFWNAYAKGKATGSWRGTEPIWRTYIAVWAAQHALRLPGDFVECGVNRGGMSLAIMEYLDFNSRAKKFYLLDTYSGFPKELLDSVNAIEAAQFTDCHDDVAKTFAKFHGAVIVRGKVPDTLPELESARVAYLSLDMNHPVPEIAAMRFFWPRLVPGAIVLLDDYAYSEMYRSQKEAFDKLAGELDFCILTLPTGQGLIVKGSQDGESRQT